MSPLNLRCSTLLEALSLHAQKGASLVLVEDDGSESRVAYADIQTKARRLARALVADGVVPGEIIPMVLPTSLDFVVSLFGILLAGATPSALGLPAGFGDIDGFAKRTATICRFLQAKRIVVSPGLAPYATGGTDVIAITEPLAMHGDDDVALPPVFDDDVAILQCTSGSTGLPKGVVLTHANVLANVQQIGMGVDVNDEDVVVAWLPLNHDMGLIGSLLFSIYWNLPLALLSPVSFLRRPASWLQTIARHKGTLSPAPNFAYAYVTSRAKDTELENVDLSSWRVAFCGAEPIAPHTMRSFQARFADRGLRKNVVLPCYGLAEACLAVTFRPAEAPLLVDCIDRDKLATGEVRYADGGDVPVVNVVSCGRPLPGTELEIRDREGNVQGDDAVGRIMVRGPSIMREYLNDAERSAEARDEDGWLWTGDLGYVRGGELFVTGREKDLIILRGKNFVPSEFEWAAEKVPGVRRGNAVAFGVPSNTLGTEMLVLACETDLTSPEERRELERLIITEVMKETGIRPDVVRLTGRERLPKTTSGKLQRAKVKQAYVEEKPSKAWRLY